MAALPVDQLIRVLRYVLVKLGGPKLGHVHFILRLFYVGGLIVLWITLAIHARKMEVLKLDLESKARALRATPLEDNFEENFPPAPEDPLGDWKPPVSPVPPPQPWALLTTKMRLQPRANNPRPLEDVIRLSTEEWRHIAQPQISYPPHQGAAEVPPDTTPNFERTVVEHEGYALRFLRQYGAMVEVVVHPVSETTVAEFLMDHWITPSFSEGMSLRLCARRIFRDRPLLAHTTSHATKKEMIIPLSEVNALVPQHNGCVLLTRKDFLPGATRPSIVSITDLRTVVEDKACNLDSHPGASTSASSATSEADAVRAAPQTAPTKVYRVKFQRPQPANPDAAIPPQAAPPPPPPAGADAPPGPVPPAPPPPPPPVKLTARQQRWKALPRQERFTRFQRWVAHTIRAQKGGPLLERTVANNLMVRRLARQICLERHVREAHISRILENIVALTFTPNHREIQAVADLESERLYAMREPMKTFWLWGRFFSPFGLAETDVEGHARALFASGF